ncbi:MAG: hypothetical protein A4S12_03555 [Proteobacteria bacterium SG_bin5]|nr:MAG: hypothetical protein A4S12_03555 [Proteobacteria bacterium SG_bin5]
MTSLAAHATNTSGTGRLILSGAVLWALGVALLRFAASSGWLDAPLPLAGFYALTIGFTWPLIPLVTRFAGLPRAAAVEATALVCATAVTLDGLVIGFAPWIYASDLARAKAVAGCLLWAIGVALVLGFARRRA